MDTSQPSTTNSNQHPTIILGVAGVVRKLHSAPMKAIVESIRQVNSHFHVILLDDNLMCTKSVETWPIVDALLALYSPHFPLDRVLQYVALRSPLLVNNLRVQPLLMDRRDIRQTLADAGIPTPKAVCADRLNGDIIFQTGHLLNTLVVQTSTTGTSYTIDKPFVEKPVDPEDHNVFIYYKDGGIRKLFRKTKNESSRYIPHETKVRQTGNYVYEKFYQPQQCVDVKVYGVGDYFHAEARKAPHIDGIVDRDQCGLERRSCVQLTHEERDMCRRVSAAFDQFIIGFDLLRAPGAKRYIIDVNGWSLVKNSKEYPITCAKLLVQHITQNLHQLHHFASHDQDPLPSSLSSSSSQNSLSRSSTEFFDTNQHRGPPCSTNTFLNRQSLEFCT